MIDHAVRRAQVYSFLSSAFLYPYENWTKEVLLVRAILSRLTGFPPDLPIAPLPLDMLQAEHRETFGAAGSPCYETEWGLPNEYRQSQELADIAGFYQAFGFRMGGRVHERPDHVAAELEFMSVLALKEAYAEQRGIAEQVEICADAQRKFLADHLGRWIGLLAETLRRMAVGGPYQALASFAQAFVSADAAQLGVELQQPELIGIRPTPPGPDLSSCGDCPLAGEDLLS